MQIVLNGEEFDLDIMDVNAVSRTLTSLSNYVKQRKSVKDPVESCDLIDAFIDEVLGEDIHKQIFKGKRRVDEYALVALTLIDEIGSQVKACSSTFEEIDLKMKKLVTSYGKDILAD